MKKTLLELVQNILNEMDSDEVNSIDDTVESSQVAQIVRSCYDEIISRDNWPHLKKMVQLEASDDITKPNYLRLPSGTKELVTFKYDKRKINETKVQYRDVSYRYPDEFLAIINFRNTDLDNIDLVEDPSRVLLAIHNNKAPDFWTSFDDEFIVCDSYNKEVETTLKKVKTQCIAYMNPVWEQRDDFIPDLPSEAFSLLEEEAKSTTFLALKQMANQKAEQKAARQQRWLSRKSWQAQGGIRYPSFGRKGLK